MTLWNLFRPRKVKSKNRRDDKIPAACYDECNNAILVAESNGIRPEICEPGSTFETSLSDCHACIEYNSEDPVTTFELVLPAFQQFIDYCGTNTTSNTTLVAIAESVVQQETSILSQKSVLSASQSSLDARLSSLGYQSPTTSTTGTPSRPSSSTSKPTSQRASPLVTTVLITPKASSTPAPTPKPHSTTGTIVAAVIAPVVVISLICIGIFLFMRRQKRTAAAQGDNSGEKPQLHSDDLKPIQLELDSSHVWEMKAWKEHPPNVAELPAVEVVGSEMDAESRPQQQHDAK